jgi:hypothetical protein
MRQHVSLIIPPSAFLLDERVFVSLGVLKVASVLERQGHHVDVLDLSGIKNYLDAISAYIDMGSRDVIGLTCTTLTAEKVSVTCGPPSINFNPGALVRIAFAISNTAGS